MLKSIKQTILRSLRTAGVFERMRSSGWRRKRLAILCYHGIALDDENEWNHSLYLAPAEFRARMQTLRLHGYTVLPLADAVERLRNGTLPSAAVAITLDDGTFDFYAGALPILRELDLPSTVYQRTDWCGADKTPVSLMLAYLFWKRRGNTFDLRDLVGCDADLTTLQGRNTAWTTAIDFIRLRRLSDGDQQQLVETVAGRLGIDYAALRARRLLQIMSPGEVAAAAAAGVGIELHTHTHRCSLDREQFCADISENRKHIVRITGVEPRHFCYPSGVWRPQFLPWLSSLGVISATTCEPALATRRGNPLLLPRFIDTGFQSVLEFESWLTGASTLLPRNFWYYRRKRRWQNRIEPLYG